MTELLNAARPDFFGKDSFTPFFGQIEDVNDPNQSGRVKVRCIGWHPFNRGESSSGEGSGTAEESLSTDDLPWARVGMPATHAQQGRVGGKHGLQVGCWVMGFFVDGDEAQDPFIICTFNHTAKVSQKDNRKDEAGTDGKLPAETEGFTKLANNENVRNISRLTEEEQGEGGYKAAADPAGDTILTDQTENDCGELESVASQRRMKEQLSKDGEQNNPESQKYPTMVADGYCGDVQHATKDTQRAIQERMPTQKARTVYGDAVWQSISGNYIDMNGIMLQLAQQICSYLKQPLNAKKQQQEDKQNRPQKSQMLQSIPDRTGFNRIELDIESTALADQFHALYQGSFIDILCQILLALLQAMQNGGLETGGANLSGLIGAGGFTPISNNSALCLAQQLIESVDALADQAIETATAGAAAVVEAQKAGEGGLEGALKALMQAAQQFTALAGMLGINFVTEEKLASKPEVFHQAGDATEDKANKEGCNQERFYDTEKGYTQGAMGPSAGGGAGGGFGGIGGFIGGGNLPGFGGLPVIGTPVVNVIPCEDALTDWFPDDYDDGRYDPDDDDGYGLDGIFQITNPDAPTAIVDIEVSGPTIIEIGRNARYVAKAILEDPKYDVNTKYYWKVEPDTGIATNASTEEMSSDISVQFSRVGRYKITARVENDFCVNSGASFSVLIQARKAKDMPKDGVPEIILPGINTYPNGKGAVIQALTLPSSDPDAAANFIRGIPNQAVVINPGKQYYYRNNANPKKTFPSTYIKGYKGDAIPVIDKVTGEFVALLTAPKSWNMDNPGAQISVIPDNNELGITTQDPDYDVELGGFYIQNTGRGYTNPTINIVDKDTEAENGEVEAVVQDGRIVDVKIKNSGRNFKRIPKLEVKDKGKSKKLKDLEKEMEKRGLERRKKKKGDKPTGAPSTEATKVTAKKEKKNNPTPTPTPAPTSQYPPPTPPGVPYDRDTFVPTRGSEFTEAEQRQQAARATWKMRMAEQREEQARLKKEKQKDKKKVKEEKNNED